MKAETQANALASLVQKKKPYTQYELILPLFQVKQSTLKKLNVGDVLLVGLDEFTLLLVSGSNICASAKIVYNGDIHKLKIANLKNDTTKQEHTKKYQKLKCSFGFLQSSKLKVDNTVSIKDINLKRVRLFIKDINIAEAILVKINDEIAIEITKVYHV